LEKQALAKKIDSISVLFSVKTKKNVSSPVGKKPKMQE